MTPWIARNIVWPAHERLIGRRTFAVLRELRRTQWWTLEQIRRLQLRKLQELVAVALRDSGFYARFAGLDPNWRPESLDDLARLPLMDRQTISAHREELVNRRVPGGAIPYRTGGSSGKTLAFYFDRRRQAWDKAARMRTHEWWGVRVGDREAYVWNAPVELSKQDRMKQFRDWLINDKLFPASTLSPVTIGPFVESLRRFRPACLFGYPSVLALMCDLARSAGLRLDDLGVRAVFATAEVLYEHQRRTITQALAGAPVADGYGSREAGFIAHECPSGGMHTTDENVIVEVLRDGRPASPGEDGEIVVTQLDNHAMPFIRYRTEDVGQLASGACPCGRGLGLMKVVQGRSTDFLVAPDGHYIHGSALSAVFIGTPGVVKFQLHQRADQHVRILIVRDSQFPADGEAKVLSGILQRLGPGGSASVEYRDDIPPGPSGKYRYIISELAAVRAEGEAT